MADKSPNNHTLDSDDKSALFEGMSIGMLAQVFKMDKRKVSKLLAGLKPSGKRHGYPIYDIAEAASLLAVPPDDQIVEALRRIPMNKLPVHLQKEFWDAARSRQTYEENSRDLWRTEDVINTLSDILKAVRQSVTLFADAVARETELTDKQRGAIEALCDDLLADMHARITGNPELSQRANRLIADDVGLASIPKTDFAELARDAEAASNE